MASNRYIIRSATPLARPAQRLVDRLAGRLRMAGLTVDCDMPAGTGRPFDFVFTPAGAPAPARPPGPLSEGIPESFTLEPLAGGGVTLAASDLPGCLYGLAELEARAVLAPPGVHPLALPGPVRTRPQAAVRSVNLFLHNRDLEREWFFSADHWQCYFELMARSRLNAFSLTYGHQTAYLAPPFPFMVAVPGYERVSTPGFAPADRERHLEALRMISGLAAEWGIRFVLGVWMQHAHEYGRSMVGGLSYEDLFDYCPKALGRVLEACPGIGGVQFRMNEEAGVRKEDQPRFFRGMLAAIRERRPGAWVDLRAKGIRAESIEAAREMGFDCVVSTKFWTEHMGLPFFLSQTNPIDSDRRYGYWDLLAHDRPYRLLYRLWTVGSNKILAWGGPAHAARFAEACRLGGAIGFEICAPLSNKGFGNRPGAWPLIEDPGLRSGDWEFERYWPILMAFGLGGYSPDAEQPVYEAEFTGRFGVEAGPRLRAALAHASRVMPLLTAAHLPSASTFGYWPELYSGGSSDVYAGVQPAEWMRFHGVSDYVNDLLAGTRRPRRTPRHTAAQFEAIADAAEAPLRDAAAGAGGPERRLLEIDIAVLALLARYHAARLRSAVGYLLFLRTGNGPRLDEAIAEFDRAVALWRRVASLTAGVYHRRMVFNRAPDQVGHWSDETPLLEAELERLRSLRALWEAYRGRPREGAALKAPEPWYELPWEWEDDGAGGVARRPGALKPAGPLTYPLKHWIGRRFVMERPESIVRRLCALRLARGGDPAAPAPDATAWDEDGPAIEARDVRTCTTGIDLPVTVAVRTAGAPAAVTLHYRRMVQCEEWTSAAMAEVRPGLFAGVIPGAAIDPRRPLLYAVSAVDAKGRIAVYPDLDERPPYVVVEVV